MSSLALFWHGLKWFVFGLLVGSLAVWWFKDWIRAQATAMWVWLKAKITHTPPALFIVLLFVLGMPCVSIASSDTATVGDSVTISVLVNGGTPPFSYQWSKNGIAITGATSATYVITSAQLTDAGTYSAKIGNSAGSVVSDNAVLAVNPLILPPVSGTTGIIVTKKQTAALIR